MEIEIASRLALLGHPHRLALLRLLVRRYPDRVPAGELAKALDLPNSTLSSHIASLSGAGLIDQARRGTSLQYSARIDSLREIVDFLWLDCCRGRTDLCDPVVTQTDWPTDRRLRVLFVCTGNSARSVLAEALLRDLAGDRFEVVSGGTAPKPAANPLALSTLARHGHSASGAPPKDLSAFRSPDAAPIDIVITVCDRAANEDCPAWQGAPVTGHWGLADPAAVTGSDAEKAAAFDASYAVLLRCLVDFLDRTRGATDKQTFQQAIDDVARNLKGHQS